VFVAELIDKADLADIDAHMTAHVTFLKQVLRFRQFPDLGSKDTARRRDHPDRRQESTAHRSHVEEDPFDQDGLADFRIIEFRASQISRAATGIIRERDERDEDEWPDARAG